MGSYDDDDDDNFSTIHTVDSREISCLGKHCFAVKLQRCFVDNEMKKFLFLGWLFF